MGTLAAGLTLFFGVHLLPSWPQARHALQARWGEGPYKGAFSLVSITALYLIIIGKARAPYVHVFVPPAWGRHAAMSLMLAATVLWTAMFLPTNLKRWTAHPMLWGFTFWASAHLLANGDGASVALFGSFLTFALFDMWSANHRGSLPRGARLPFARDLVLLLAALLLYAALLFIHPYAFGAAVLRG